MHRIDGEACSIFGEGIDSAFEDDNDSWEVLCPICSPLELHFAKSAAYGSYESGLRDLIHLLKYQQVRPAANVLGRMLAEVIADLEAGWAAASVLVVPVPLYAGKFCQRGFNQAELIARVALKLSSARDACTIATDVLERSRETQSQIGLTRHQRRENLRGAFRVTNREKVSGREILLVDDVFTTGTTASECARVLRRAGAARVWVATVARTLKAELQAVSFEPQDDESLTMAAHG